MNRYTQLTCTTYLKIRKILRRATEILIIRENIKEANAEWKRVQRKRSPKAGKERGNERHSVFCRQATPLSLVHEKERFFRFFALNFINFLISNVFFRGFFGGDDQRGTSAPEKCRKHSARVNLAKWLAVPNRLLHFDIISAYRFVVHQSG